MKKEPIHKPKRKSKEAKPVKNQVPSSPDDGKSRWKEFLEKHSKVGKKNPYSN